MRKIKGLLRLGAVAKVAYEIWKRTNAKRQSRAHYVLEPGTSPSPNAATPGLDHDTTTHRYGRTPQDERRTISEVLAEPRQQDVPDEARVISPDNEERGWEEVTERAEKEDAGELPQRGPKS